MIYQQPKKIFGLYLLVKFLTIGFVRVKDTKFYRFYMFLYNDGDIATCIGIIFHFRDVCTPCIVERIIMEMGFFVLFQCVFLIFLIRIFDILLTLHLVVF